MRILDFWRWVIFELLIDVVFGCWEYRRKKGNERKGKENKFFEFFFYLLCWGCRLNSVDSLWENYGFVVSMKEFDGFW